ncbi:MAG: cytochrome d ubiquinol oxidase subunit II [Thermodesulfobacteriota bacterium]
MELMLPDIWFAILGFVLFLAVVLDGFDLGIGILSLFTQDENRRSLLMGSIGPVWHANLTWLVVLGGLFFGAFPLAYGVIFSALYIPVILMVIALAFRGVSFDFREESQDKRPWNLAFGLGSLIAALAQGFALGGFLSGFKMQGDNFVGGVWDWLNPFAALVALALLGGYVLLGATWLILKTAGDAQADGYRYAKVGAWSLLVLAVALGGWSIHTHPLLARKWFTFPDAWLTFGPFLLAAMAFILLIRSLLKLQETAPFVWSVVFFALAMFSGAASLHPYVIPPTITLTAAAAPPQTLVTMLGLVAVVLPVMLIYNGYQYLVFRGKVTRSGYGAYEE